MVILKNGGGLYDDVTIYSLNQIKESTDKKNIAIVISAPSIRKDINKALKSELPYSAIYSFEIEAYECFNIDVNKYKKWLLENVDRIYNVYSQVNDSKSRNVLMNIIKARVTADLDYIDLIYEKDQYFPKDIIRFDAHERIIESGSNNGNTLKELCAALNNRYDHIYCFEPDSMCEKSLSTVINELNPSGNKITYYQKGTSDESQILYFNQVGENLGLSKISDAGNTAIEVVALDDMNLDNISYIKMDIEGAELDTLHGAQNMIKRDKPKLAICLYHKMEDIVTIPEFLREINPDYHFYIRHHNCVITETVLYAI